MIPIASQRLGLTVSAIIIDYPGWHGVTIRLLEASWERVTLRARNTRISYSWQQLLRGRVDKIQVHNLAIALQPTATEISQPTQINKPIPLTTLFNTLPSEHVKVQRLTFEFSERDFNAVGSLSLTPTGLSLSVSAAQAT
ncbi:MAG: hypothetical protein GXP16_08265, partial [Gammaproteobacteria bacterium]|nr:hypothetical protein [Gammaproteobacteria bacterium]